MLVTCALLVGAADPYAAGVEAWRAKREADLKADGGWLTVVDLYWLHEGRNTFGTDRSNEMVLPAGSAEPRVGWFELRQGGVWLRYAADPGNAIEMKSDQTEKPTVIQRGRLTFSIIERGPRLGVRLKDTESPYRKQYKGLTWYPVKPEFQVRGRFVPFDRPRTMRVPSVIGEDQEYTSPGRVEFQIGGRPYSLEPAQEEDELFFIFKDATSGKSTYPAGRFLAAPLPKNGTVMVDFNKAYNPPCAFTPYATCPLPPPQNRLDVAIEAGEKNYEHAW